MNEQFLNPLSNPPEVDPAKNPPSAEEPEKTAKGKTKSKKTTAKSIPEGGSDFEQGFKRNPEQESGRRAGAEPGAESGAGAKPGTEPGAGAKTETEPGAGAKTETVEPHATEEKSVLEDPLQTDNQPDRTLPADPPADRFDPQELGQLREELNRLREEIRSSRKALIEQEAELEEFRDLFPDASLSALPDVVLSDIQRGVPLAAAYALNERRSQRLAKIAESANAANRARSSGSAEGDSVGFLSPAEVRNMTPTEVRKQYRQILLSMPKWH